jgi:hypothetical protein
MDASSFGSARTSACALRAGVFGAAKGPSFESGAKPKSPSSSEESSAHARPPELFSAAAGGAKGDAADGFAAAVAGIGFAKRAARSSRFRASSASAPPDVADTVGFGFTAGFAAGAAAAGAAAGSSAAI